MAFTAWSLMCCGNRRLLALGTRRVAGLLGRVRNAEHDGACSPVTVHLMALRGSDIHGLCDLWPVVQRVRTSGT